MTQPIVLVDVFEKSDLPQLLASWHLNIVRTNMVPLGLADITWTGLDGKLFTQEHKTMSQLLSDMGDRLDNQLRKHTQHAADVSLCVDGLITPKTGGGCDLWRRSKDGRYFHKYRSVAHGYEAVFAYLWSLDKQGINVYLYPDIESLALALASQVYNTLKQEHRSLVRYTKSKPIVRSEDISESNQINTLIGLGGSRIGEVMARRILEHFGTPWNFYLSDVSEAKKAGVGESTFKGVMRAIGRMTY